MPRAPTEIRSIARKWTTDAIDTLVEIMKDKDAAPSARQSAAQALLDRGWGKAVQPVGNDEGETFKVELIKRVIVGPDDKDA